jgi:hypothetical protein
MLFSKYVERFTLPLLTGEKSPYRGEKKLLTVRRKISLPEEERSAYLSEKFLLTLPGKNCLPYRENSA